MQINIMNDFERFLYTGDRSEGTVTTYIRIVNLLQDFIAREYNVDFEFDHVNMLKGFMISNWATSLMEFKVTTRTLYLTAATVFLKYLFDMDYIEKDLSSALPKKPNIERYRSIHPEEISEKRNYSHEELNALMKECNASCFTGARRRAIIATLVMTGLRASELASLNCSDALSGENFVRVARKGTHGNKVEVPFPSEIQKYLIPYLDLRAKRGLSCGMDDPLFVTNNGSRMSRHRIYDTLKTVEQKVGVPTGVHTFRHTTLSEISKSANPVVARDVAGQKTITVTNRYLHSTSSEKLSAAADLAKLFA